MTYQKYSCYCSFHRKVCGCFTSIICIIAMLSKCITLFRSNQHSVTEAKISVSLSSALCISEKNTSQKIPGFIHNLNVDSKFHIWFFFLFHCGSSWNGRSLASHVSCQHCNTLQYKDGTNFLNSGITSGK